MTRHAAVVALLALALTPAAALAAQEGAATTSPPALDALRVGAIPADAVSASDTATTGDSAKSARAAVARRDAALVARRRVQFAAVGGLAGLVGGFVWLRHTARQDPLTGLAVATIGPFLAPVVATAGGAVGYGVSFLVYPPHRRAER